MIYPVCQGEYPKEEELVKDPRVHYLYMEQDPLHQNMKRQAVSLVMNEHADGKYIAWTDSHCAFDYGWNSVLENDSKPNRVQCPRRNRLDGETFGIQIQGDDRPPIDAEYVMFQPLIQDKAIHNFKWDARTLALWDETIIDAFCVQASFFYMEKSWWDSNDFMNHELYSGWGNENEDVCWETWFRGGDVKINKKTWYAHLHRGKRWGRGYHLSKKETLDAYAFSYNRWVIERKDFFCSFIERFMPIPGFPSNWKERIYNI